MRLIDADLEKSDFKDVMPYDIVQIDGVKVGLYRGPVIQQVIDQQPTATCWEPFLFNKDGTLMNCPDDEQRILVCDGKQVWCDLFCNEGECWLDETSEEIVEGMAWMPMPELYRKDGAE